MSEQPKSTASQIFYLEIIVPALFVFFVIYGLPPILKAAIELRESQTHCAPAPSAADKPSPPASGTGPPVAGDGGETG